MSVLIKNTLKFMGLLLLVQLVLVLLLLVRLESQGERIDELARSAAQVEQGEPVSTAGPQSSPVNSISGQTGPDSQQLRLMIREELAAALSHSELAVQNTRPEKEPVVYDEAEMQYRRELVLEELEMLKGQVEVSSGELERLMDDIAKLNPEARTELMKILNQAMNRGEIKGHL